MQNKSVEEKFNELRMTGSDGTIVDVQLESIMFSHQSWRSEQYRTVIIDITERKQMEKEQDALRLQLHQSHKMESIRTIAGGIAHDFNNILFMISGNAELAITETRDWHPAYPKLERIRTAALRAAGIVKLLLSFSQTSDEKQIPIDVISVIKDTLILLRASIPTTIAIHTKFPDEAVMILSDKIQIGQILMNLCTNASQAMEETGGLLEISVGTKFLPEGTAGGCPAGDYAEITVKDNGPGIAPGILDRIFDPYFTTREIGKGSGLGLAEKLIRIRPDIPIVLCTGHSSLIDEEKARQLGIASYMMKPVSMLKIAKNIRKLMDHKNAKSVYKRV